MSMFVAIFLFQWWPYIAQALCILLGRQIAEVFIITVIIVNLGGVFNAVVYSVIRRKYTAVGQEHEGTATMTMRS